MCMQVMMIPNYIACSQPATCQNHALDGCCKDAPKCKFDETYGTDCRRPRQWLYHTAMTFTTGCAMCSHCVYV